MDKNYLSSQESLQQVVWMMQSVYTIQTLDDIIKAPMSVVKDPQGTSALMHYSQMCKNCKLYNVEVLYDKAANEIKHFKYTQKSLGPLPTMKLK